MYLSAVAFSVAPGATVPFNVVGELSSGVTYTYLSVPAGTYLSVPPGSYLISYGINFDASLAESILLVELNATTGTQTPLFTSPLNAVQTSVSGSFLLKATTTKNLALGVGDTPPGVPVPITNVKFAYMTVVAYI